jgi:hypothetical protein
VNAKPDLSVALLAGSGMRVAGATIAGLLIGIALAKYAHWTWAAPAGIVLGFAGGFFAAYRDLARQMR